MSRVACHTRKFLLRCLMASAAIVALHAPADAQIGSARYSSIVVDASSGDVLEAINPDQPRHPASLTKMMTLYMAFEALRDRRISLDTLVPVSPHAASMEPTKLGLVPGTHLTVEQAILGMITRSANDAASAMGELLGGTEDRFSQMMTLRARALGMSHTVFVNASGLPDPAQISTARDLAVLSRRLITDFPGYYRYFSTPSFVWHRQVIFNHDTMLKMYPGADGLKTGYTEASGHNLVTSAVRGGVRLIGVVLGAATNGERDIHMAALLDHGFEEEDVPVLRRAPPLPTRITLISSAHAAEVPRAPTRTRTSFAVQVGSFKTEAAARAAAAHARREADAGDIRVEPVHLRGRTVWRAHVVGLTETDAQDACGGHRKTKCLIIRGARRKLAIR